MLFGVYADVGGGILFLLLLALLGLGLLAWVAYWAMRGFRASFPKGKSWAWWLLRVGTVVTALLCFPPFRRSGDWRELGTGRPIPPETAIEFDRFLFGYIPSYGWIGSLGREEAYHPGCVATIYGRGPYQCSSYWWVIDWWFLGAELAALVVLLLPFFRARGGGVNAEPSAAADRPREGR